MIDQIIWRLAFGGISLLFDNFNLLSDSINLYMLLTNKKTNSSVLMLNGLIKLFHNGIH